MISSTLVFSDCLLFLSSQMAMTGTCFYPRHIGYYEKKTKNKNKNVALCCGSQARLAAHFAGLPRDGVLPGGVQYTTLGYFDECLCIKVTAGVGKVTGRSEEPPSSCLQLLYTFARTINFSYIRTSGMLYSIMYSEDGESEFLSRINLVRKPES